VPATAARPVPQEEYVRCEQQFAGRLVWIKVVRVVDARFTVGGVEGRGGRQGGDAEARGRILPAERIRLYGSSACGP
jgi:hypothetical protein